MTQLLQLVACSDAVVVVVVVIVVVVIVVVVESGRENIICGDDTIAATRSLQ